MKYNKKARKSPLLPIGERGTRMANDAHAKKPIVIERRREKGRRKSPRLTKTYEVKSSPPQLA